MNMEIKPQSHERIVQVGAGMGGLTAVMSWAFQSYTGVIVPVEVGIGLSTFLTFVVQYWIPRD